MKMLETVRNLPNVSQKDLLKKEILRDYSNFKNIVYAGIGGSGITGDIVKDLIFEEAKIPFVVSKGFDLPKFADENTLFICVSYSGNTRETISQLSQAIKSKCKIYIITSNGYLEKFAIENKIPYTKLPGGYLPRMSVPYIFLAVTDLLHNLKIIKNTISFKNLEKYSKEVEDLSLKIAKSIHGKQIVIYSEFYSVCHRFKSQLNENAKEIARYEILPELVHNEIETWKNLNENHSVLLFLDNDKSKPIEKVIQVLKEMMGKNADLVEIRAKGETKFERLFYLIWIGEFISYFLAELKNEDSVKTPSLALFKSKIG